MCKRIATSCTILHAQGYKYHTIDECICHTLSSFNCSSMQNNMGIALIYQLTKEVHIFCQYFNLVMQNKYMHLSCKYFCVYYA